MTALGSVSCSISTVRENGDYEKDSRRYTTTDKDSTKNLGQAVYYSLKNQPRPVNVLAEALAVLEDRLRTDQPATETEELISNAIPVPAQATWKEICVQEKLLIKAAMQVVALWKKYDAAVGNNLR